MMLNIKKEIKSLLFERDMTMKKLCEIMSKKLGKKYTSSNFSNKLAGGTIPYREVKLIAEILQYEIKFIDKLYK